MAGAGAGVGTVLRWGMVLVLRRPGDGWDGTGIEAAGIESWFQMAGKRMTSKQGIDDWGTYEEHILG